MLRTYQRVATYIDRWTLSNIYFKLFEFQGRQTIQEKLRNSYKSPQLEEEWGLMIILLSWFNTITSYLVNVSKSSLKPLIKVRSQPYKFGHPWPSQKIIGIFYQLSVKYPRKIYEFYILKLLMYLMYYETLTKFHYMKNKSQWFSVARLKWRRYALA